MIDSVIACIILNEFQWYVKFRLFRFPSGKPKGDATMGQKGLGWKAQGWVSNKARWKHGTDWVAGLRSSGRHEEQRQKQLGQGSRRRIATGWWRLKQRRQERIGTAWAVGSREVVTAWAGCRAERARGQLGFYLGPARFLSDDAGKRWTRVLGEDGFLGSTADLMAAGI
ncbi:hypothetical protein M0R45_015458 [Rubus argutus]|uniref:Uncharacterized protein n=1 Tax=Rubus argutus TaxID=59490 RepID=A0AAW1XQS4_RUBAR